MINKFAQRLKEIRSENKMNQMEFALKCNVQQSCVSKWERGATLPDAEMQRVACQRGLLAGTVGLLIEIKYNIAALEIL